MSTLVLVAIVAFAAGYLTGHWRPLVALFGWAEDQTRDRPVRFWVAQPILAVALAAVFVFRPRRTLANVRAAREAAALPSPPAIDFDQQNRGVSP